MRFEIQNETSLLASIKEFCEFLERERVPKEQVFDSRLVLSELLGNVLRHARGSASFEGDINGEVIELKIYSPHVYYPKDGCKCAEVYSEHGRGLFLVQNVCEEDIFIEEDGLRLRIRLTR